MGAGALLAISAPSALAAGSNRTLTITNITSCSVVDQASNPKTQATVSGQINGTGFTPNVSTTINFTVTFVQTPSAIAGGTATLTFTPTSSSFTQNFTVVANENGNNRTYKSRSYSITATNTMAGSGVPTVTASGAGIAGACPA